MKRELWNANGTEEEDQDRLSGALMGPAITTPPTSENLATVKHRSQGPTALIFGSRGFVPKRFCVPAHGVRAERYICFCMRDRPGETSGREGCG